MDIVDELRDTADRITRYTNKPHDGLMFAAADEIERLNLELQKREKCSFMGAMRDCPTHGDLPALKEAYEMIRELLFSGKNVIHKDCEFKAMALLKHDLINKP